MVHGILPVGTLNAEYWQHYLGEAVPLFLMPYAVDNDYFQQRSLEAIARRDELRQELGLDAGEACHPLCVEAAAAQTLLRFTGSIWDVD